MDDDLNTARALGVLYEMAREVNRWLDSGRELSHESIQDIDATFRTLGGDVLGVIPVELTAAGGGARVLDGVMSIILGLRQEYREARDWERADALRAKLSELGITVEDRPDGPAWRMETQ
jgi:cysteinyl-tRNA synthetase